MKFSFPHPLAILVLFISLAAALTYVIPAGEYDRELDVETGRQVVVANSFKTVESEPLSFFEAVLKIPEGIIYGADIIVLILLIGGAFFVVDRTGAFNDGLTALTYKFRHSRFVVLILVGSLFAIGGALNNLGEEIIAMIPVLILMTDRMGYTRIAAVGISLGSAVIGSAFSPINPFAVLIAQKIAEVEVFSGSMFRLVALLITSALWIWWIIKYGKSDDYENTLEPEKPNPISRNSAIILLLVVLTFVIMVYGIMRFEWGFNEMSALFFIMGVVCGLIGKMGINGTSSAYAQGMQEIAFAGVVVGLARSIYLTLEEGKIIDSIVHSLFTPLQDLPLYASAFGMTISQAILHIPVPSNSGQAVLTMPLLSPLSDLIGMSRQVMILCYQAGGALMDLINPTNGVLLAILAAAKISYKDWVAFAWKPYLIILAVGLAFVFLGIFIGLE